LLKKRKTKSFNHRKAELNSIPPFSFVQLSCIMGENS